MRGTYQRHPRRPTWYRGGSDRKWPGRPCLAAMAQITKEGTNQQTQLNQTWLVVSTHLNNISQNGNLPQIGVENTFFLKPPPSKQTNKQASKQTNKQASKQPSKQANKQTKKQTNKQTKKQTSKQTNKQTNKQANNQANKQTNKRTNKQTNKETSKQTNKQTSKQTNKQASKQINKQTNKQTSKQASKQTNKETSEQTTVCHSIVKATTNAAKSVDTDLGRHGEGIQIDRTERSQQQGL